MTTLILAIIFGTLIGLMLGLVGGGGSILTVPILVYILGQDVHEATATSLVIVGVTSLFGAVPHATAGRVSMKTALYFGGAGIAGAYAGTALNRLVSGPVILLLFGGLMLIVAGRMALSKKKGKSATGTPEQVPDRFQWSALVAGLVVGVMTGFFGVGGGFLIVPALVLVLGFPMRVAVGTSLVIITINSIAGASAHLSTGDIDFGLAAFFIIGGILGSTFGARAAGRVNEARLSQGFAGMIAVIGLYLIIQNAAQLA